MTEMMGVTVTAGGSVTRQTWREFMRDMEATGFVFDVHQGDGTLYFSDEANFGNTDEVQSACREHGIAYTASSDAKYEYDGVLHVWFPGMESRAEATSSQGGDAYIPVKDLKAALDAGRSLQDLADEHEAFLRPVPRMLIDDVPATEADLDDIALEGEGDPDWQEVATSHGWTLSRDGKRYVDGDGNYHDTVGPSDGWKALCASEGLDDVKDDAE